MISLILASLFVYQREITRTYGIHTITSITLVNNFCTARQAVGVRPELTDDPELKATLQRIEKQNNLNIFEDTKELRDFYLAHPDIFEKYVNRLMSISPLSMAKRIFFRTTMEVSEYRIFWPSYIYPNELIDKTVSPNMMVYWTVMIWFVVLFLKQWCRQRKVPIVSGLFIMVTLGITFASIVGAMAEWSRLIMPGLPIFFLICGKLCSMYKLKKPVPLNS